MAFTFSTCLPERDNPWDEKTDLEPDAWAPKNLVITANTDSSVMLSWQYDGNPLIDGFIIDRKKDNAPWTEGFAVVSSDQKKFNDNTVTPPHTWSYRLRSNAGSNYSTAIENSIELNFPDGTTSTIKYNGYTYQTIYINGREWFAENLQTSKFQNGDNIPNVSDSSTWSELSTPGYCFYNNDQKTHENNYGALYNWYAVISRDLCPIGWHVPTDAEWSQLTDYLGGYEVAGSKLKNTTGWKDNRNGNNESGFSALPGGYRSSNGSFYNIGHLGYWWSSKWVFDTNSAWSRYLGYGTSGGIGRGGRSMGSGFSVRCIRD